MVKFSVVFAQALDTLKSNTLAEMTDSDITAYLNTLLFRAIADFRLPRIALDYQEVAGETGSYQFINNITQREINVLLELMKYYWIKHQIDDESRFEDLFYDKDVKTYSKGNLLAKLNERLKMAKTDVKEAQYNYSRVLDGKSTLEALYE